MADAEKEKPKIFVRKAKKASEAEIKQYEATKQEQGPPDAASVVSETPVFTSQKTLDDAVRTKPISTIKTVFGKKTEIQAPAKVQETKAEETKVQETKKNKVPIPKPMKRMSTLQEIQEDRPNISKFSDELKDVADDIFSETYGDHYYLKKDGQGDQKLSSTFIPTTRRGFANFIQTQFKHFQLPPLGKPNPDACKTQMGAQQLQVYLYQQFIREYMRSETPYRGILVYHGLGSGKTCSAIAASEALFAKARKKIIIMTPKSLRENFIKELMTCGFQHYKLQNHWEEVAMNETTRLFATQVLGLPDKYTYTVGTMFVPDFNRINEPNFDSLTEDKKTIIKNQIQAMIDNQFKFINYNGITAKELKDYACIEKESEKVFDNAVIVIDEIHNLVRLMQGKIEPYLKSIGISTAKISPEPVEIGRWKPKLCGQALNYTRGFLFYRLLLDAKNSKIIGLSGTPLINYPEEIAILMNVLHGYIPIATFTAEKADNDVITNMLKKAEQNEYIDFIDIKKSGAGALITLTPLPEGTIKIFNTRNEMMGVRKVDKGVVIPSFQTVVNDFMKGFPTTKFKDLKFVAEPLLPPIGETFRDTFINKKKGIVIPEREIILSKRITGLVSYYRGSKEDLMPKVLCDEIVKCPMTKYQQEEYLKIRENEVKNEQAQKKLDKKQGAKGKVVEIWKQMYDSKLVSKQSSYRMGSRQICNFAFPEEVARPKPSKDEQKAEEDIMDNRDISETDIMRSKAELLKELELDEEDNKVPVPQAGGEYENEEENEGDDLDYEDDLDADNDKEDNEEYVKAENEEEEEEEQEESSEKTQEEEEEEEQEINQEGGENSDDEDEEDDEDDEDDEDEEEEEEDEDEDDKDDEDNEEDEDEVENNNEKKEATVVRKFRADSNEESNTEATKKKAAKPTQSRFIIPSNDEENKPKKSKYIVESNEKVNGLTEEEREKAKEKEDCLAERKQGERYVDAMERAKNCLRKYCKEKLQMGLEKDDKLQKYSPKFQAIMENIESSPGSNLVYSQFLQMEGIGIFAIVMEMNGYVPIQIEMAGGDYKFSDETLKSFRKENQDKYNKKRFIMFTGNEDSDIRKKALDVFNMKLRDLPEGLREPLERNGFTDNKEGQLCRVFCITAAGAEGLSLKNVRRVHIMETYWNDVRLQQVKGRAVRICSHMDFDKIEDRTVQIYTYVSVYDMRALQDQKGWEIKEDIRDEDRLIGSTPEDLEIPENVKDYILTSDENLYMVSKRKRTISFQLENILKSSAVDCQLNHTENAILPDPPKKCGAKEDTTEKPRPIQCLILSDKTGTFMYHPVLEQDIVYSAGVKKQEQKVLPAKKYTAPDGIAYILIPVVSEVSNQISYFDVFYETDTKRTKPIGKMDVDKEEKPIASSFTLFAQEVEEDVEEKKEEVKEREKVKEKFSFETVTPLPSTIQEIDNYVKEMYPDVSSRTKENIELDDFRGQPLIKDTFQSIKTSANKNDCLIHSFLDITSPSFRKLKNKEKDNFADKFRRELLPRLYQEKAPDADEEINLLKPKVFLDESNMDRLGKFFNVNIATFRFVGNKISLRLPEEDLLIKDAPFFIIYNPDRAHFRGVREITNGESKYEFNEAEMIIAESKYVVLSGTEKGCDYDIQEKDLILYNGELARVVQVGNSRQEGNIQMCSDIRIKRHIVSDKDKVDEGKIPIDIEVKEGKKKVRKLNPELKLVDFDRLPTNQDYELNTDGSLKVVTSSSIPDVDLVKVLQTDPKLDDKGEPIKDDKGKVQTTTTSVRFDAISLVNAKKVASYGIKKSSSGSDKPDRAAMTPYVSTKEAKK